MGDQEQARLEREQRYRDSEAITKKFKETKHLPTIMYDPKDTTCGWYGLCEGLCLKKSFYMKVSPPCDFVGRMEECEDYSKKPITDKTKES